MYGKRKFIYKKNIDKFQYYNNLNMDAITGIRTNASLKYLLIPILISRCKLYFVQNSWLVLCSLFPHIDNILFLKDWEYALDVMRHTREIHHLSIIVHKAQNSISFCFSSICALLFGIGGFPNLFLFVIKRPN